MTSVEQFSRTVRRGTVISSIVILLAIVAAVLLTVVARPGSAVTTVEVHDDAGVVDAVLLEEDIGALRTYSPLRVVVWTRDGESSDGLNAKTLEWARDRPDDGLIHPNERVWSDGLLLITVSVEQTTPRGSGQVGTYFGEDVKVEPTSAQQELQSHGYDHFRNNDWTAGVTAIADAASQEMARPAWTGKGTTLGVPFVIALLAGANIVGIRLLRQRFHVASQRFNTATENVHERVSATEYVLDHGFGSKIRSSAGSVLRQYDDTLDQRNAIAATPLWKVIAVNIPLWLEVRNLNQSAGSIGETSALLARASALYLRDGEWEQVWEQEIKETADHVITARDDAQVHRRAGAQASAELRAFCDQALSDLKSIRDRGAAGGGENISECLEEIAAVRQGLTDRMNRIAHASTPANASAARHVDRAISRQRQESNRRSLSITGFYDRHAFHSPQAFTIGYASGLAQHRRAEARKENAGSSGGSSTGYGSTGGGFSGAGSSSRF